jgi:hypothetical protein
MQQTKTLQPGLSMVDGDSRPPDCANDFVFSYPVPSSLNFCCRPNTMLYGTAPYLAGKGAPADLIMVDDELRPQTTSGIRKRFEIRNEQGYPWQSLGGCPVVIQSNNPNDTRGAIQNNLFIQRYGNKIY